MEPEPCCSPRTPSPRVPPGYHRFGLGTLWLCSHPCSAWMTAPVVFQGVFRLPRQEGHPSSLTSFPRLFSGQYPGSSLSGHCIFMGVQRLDTRVLPTNHPKLGGGEEGSAEARRVKGQAALAGGEVGVPGRLTFHWDPPQLLLRHHPKPWFCFCVVASRRGAWVVPSSRARSFRKAQQDISRWGCREASAATKGWRMGALQPSQPWGARGGCSPDTAAAGL